MIFRQHRYLTLLLIVGVVASGWALAKRHSAEMHNRAVEIAVDYVEASELAGVSGKPVAAVLRELKAAGATTLSVQEVTGTDLVNSGMATVVNDGQTVRFTGVAPGSLVTLDRPISTPVKGSPEYALALPYGIPAAAIAAAKQAGMPVVVRLVNYPGVEKADLDRTAAKLHALGVKTVIFAADQVLGFRGGVEDVADSFKTHGLNYGSVEFSKQKGDERMSRKMLPDVIRVHSITAAEMGTLDRPTAIERFTKAAKERNIRLAYVRMFDLSDPEALKTNADYVHSIVSGIRKEGLGTRQSRPFKDPGVEMPVRGLIGLGVAAGLMLLVVSLVELRRSSLVKWTMLFALVFAAMAASGVTIALKLVALAAAIVFPTLAVLYAGAFTSEETSVLRLKAFLWPALRRFVSALAISISGGLMIAALLSRLSFMLHIDQFAGVKLASIAPILILAAVYAVGVGWKPEVWEEQKERALASIRSMYAQPILMWQTALAFVLLMMVALLVMRSGNEPGVGVSPLELKFRSLLDTILFVRPRTKEFLIGHPALILGIMAALGGRRRLAPVLLVVGAFGEISALNTMCHIHTPVAISIIRGAIGAVVGIVLTVVLVAIFSRTPSGPVQDRPRNVRKAAGVEK